MNMTTRKSNLNKTTASASIHVDCGPVQMRSPAELIAYARNPRKHPESRS